MAEIIEIYESKIAQWTMPAGMVYDWSNHLIRDAELIAIRTCPIAKQDWGPGHVPGMLKARHYVEMQGNQYVVTARLGNDADYASFVHDGTTRPTAHGPYMKFTINGRTYRKKSVAGQASQPWLRNALAEAAL